MTDSTVEADEIEEDDPVDEVVEDADSAVDDEIEDDAVADTSGESEGTATTELDTVDDDDEPAERPVAAVTPLTHVEARRVRRVLRRIDPWSVSKVAFVFAVCMYGIVVISSMLVWQAADSAGVVDNIEDFVVSVGFSDFNVDPGQLFRSVVVGGGLLIVVSTGFALLGSILFNLICDMVGGIKLSMIEERLVEDV